MAVSTSAIEGKDFYLIGSLTLTFLDQWNQSCSVVIINDSEPEHVEMFYLTLTNANPHESVIVSPDMFTFTIEANDGVIADKQGKSNSNNYLMLLPLTIIPIIVLAVALAYGLRRMRHSHKTTIHFTNPLSDKNTTAEVKSPSTDGTNQSPGKTTDGSTVIIGKVQNPSKLLPATHVSKPKTRPNLSNDLTKAATTQMNSKKVEKLKEIEVPLEPEKDSKSLEMKPNVAYKMMEIVERNYADPVQVQSIRRAQHVAFGTVEPYAITNICKRTV